MKCQTHNERFGATAAGSADLKGSAEMPPLRQAAIPLAATRQRHRRESAVLKGKAQLEKYFYFFFCKSKINH
jgi:hypothetical protein